MAFFKKLKSDIEGKQSPKKKKKKEPEKKDDWRQSKGQLAADIYETDSEFCILAPIAGVDQEDIDVFVENNMLVIKGERKEPEEKKEKKYFYRECYWGAFARQVILPEDVNSQKIKASFKKGVLSVSMPKKQEASKKVSVKLE